MSLIEVVSLLDIQYIKNAVNVQEDDLVDVAYLVQHQHERAATKFSQLIRDKRVVLFFNASDCTIPLGSIVEAIILEDTIICKKLN